MDIINGLMKLAGPGLVLMSYLFILYVVYFASKVIFQRYIKNKILEYPATVALLVIVSYPYFSIHYPEDTLLHMCRILISIPVLFYVPGSALYKVMMGVNRDPEGWEKLFVKIIASTLLTGWFALILADLGLFSLVNLIILNLAITLSIMYLLRKTPKTRVDKTKKARNNLSFCIPFLVFLSLILFLHPFQKINSHFDQGVYVNGGVNLGETGSLQIYDPIIRDMPKETRNAFYLFKNDRSGIEAVVYSAFYVIDSDAGLIVPAHYNFLPVYVGIFYVIFGLKNCLYCAPFLAVLSVVSIYLSGKCLFGWRAGLIASVLLTLNLTQIYFSRFVGTEILMQFLIFTGLWALMSYNRSNKGFFGVLSALGFAGVLITRLDAILIIIPLSLYLVYLIITRKLRARRYLIYPLGILCILAVIHNYFFTYSYTLHVLNSQMLKFAGYNAGLTRTDLILYPLLSLTLIAVTVLFFGKSLERIGKIRPETFTRLKKIFLVLVVLLCLYGCFIRPDQGLPYKKGKTIEMLSMHLTEAGVLLALLGLVLLMSRRSDENSWFFILLSAVYAIYYIQCVRNVLIQPWAMRRYITVVIPAFMLSIGYLLTRVSMLDKRYGLKYLPACLSGMILLSLVITYGINDIDLLNYVEGRGMIEETGKIAGFFSDDDIILCFEDEFAPLGIALPLKVVYGKNTIRDVSPNTLKISRMVRKWIIEENRSVYMINPEIDFAYELSTSFNLRHVKTFRLRGIPYLDYRIIDMPPQITLGNDKSVYRIELLEGDGHDGQDIEKLPLNIEVGVSDAGRIKGLYAVELSSQNTSYRWTKDRVEIRLPASSDGGLTVTLFAQAWRPENLSRPAINVSLDGQLTAFNTSKELTEYKFIVPEKNTTENNQVIELCVDTFNPYDSGLGGDTRDLGVMLYGLKVESREPENV